MNRTDQQRLTRISRFPVWVWGTFFIAGSLAALWMAYAAAFSVWLNAHPQHDDEYWATMFYLHGVGFCIAVVFSVFSARKGLSVANSRSAPAERGDESADALNTSAAP